ncbi:MAG TPA: S46 family peptidase [Magnetospirillaceae bacterium]|nr:S46 family peptidase [Magnetospirillaceae bacterium]
MRHLILTAALVGFGTVSAHADEGMWTFDHFPTQAVKKAYNFAADQAWLDHARLSSVRLAGGCSASFVSAHGLVQTNHHCAHSCIEQLSTAEKDFIASGYLAAKPEDEIKCPEIEVNQLVDISEVTARITKATEGKSDAAFAQALKAEKAAIAKECSGDDANLRCDVVELYQGGVYDLYKYRRYQDVRLVFAPEMDIAFFGGDPDNFEFPRYDLDVSYVRVYQDDKPLDTSANFFPYAKTEPEAGELVFTIGHPGHTDRQDTVAELTYQRDIAIPRFLIYGSEMRGMLTQFSAESAEHARIANGLLFGIENSLKARKGHFRALVDSQIVANHVKGEAELGKKVAGDPKLKKAYDGAIADIARVMADFRAKSDRYVFTEAGYGFRADLYSFARGLVRHAEESRKPNAERLAEYTDSAFPALKQRLLSTAPVYPDLDKATLTFTLTKLRENLGADDAFVKKVFGNRSPKQLAEDLIDGTKLADLDKRRALLDADPATIAADPDPMLVFFRLIDPDLRAVRKQYEDGVDAPLQKAHAEIAKARFKAEGTSVYPDATFTLRVSYGAIKGYDQAKGHVEPLTRIGGAFTRTTGAAPFALPASWLAAKDALDLNKVFDIASTNDIIGGNSGSPLINKKGEVVGLIFDGNIQSLGGDFGYDGSTNRAVSVSTGALKEALDKVYHADRIVRELSE